MNWTRNMHNLSTITNACETILFPKPYQWIKSQPIVPTDLRVNIIRIIFNLEGEKEDYDYYSFGQSHWCQKRKKTKSESHKKNWVSLIKSYIIWRSCLHNLSFETFFLWMSIYSFCVKRMVSKPCTLMKRLPWLQPTRNGNEIASKI